MQVASHRSRFAYYLSSIPTLAVGIRNWPSAALSLLLRPGHRPFTVELRNGLRFNARTALDVWIIKETCLDRDYERAGPIEKGWTIVDIGAGLGEFAVHAAKPSGTGTVYAFEPAPGSFALGQTNLKLNDVHNVRLVQSAVCGAPVGAAQLRESDEPAKSALSNKRTESKGLTQVAAITLDQFVADENLESIDLLKIDCEGGEYDILSGASGSTLARIRRIALEYHDGPAGCGNDLVRLLTDRGFTVERQPNPVHANIGLLFAMSSSFQGAG